MVISESSCLCMQGRVSDGVCRCAQADGGVGGVCMKRRDAMALGEQVFHRLLTLPGGVGSGRCDLFGEWRRGKRVQCSYYKRKRLDTYSSIVMSKAEMMQSHALSHTPPL